MVLEPEGLRYHELRVNNHVVTKCESEIRKQESGNILPQIASASPPVPVLNGVSIAAGGCKSRDVEKVFVLDPIEGAGQHMQLMHEDGVEIDPIRGEADFEVL